VPRVPPSGTGGPARGTVLGRRGGLRRGRERVDQGDAAAGPASFVPRPLGQPPVHVNLVGDQRLVQFRWHDLKAPLHECRLQGPAAGIAAREDIGAMFLGAGAGRETAGRAGAAKDEGQAAP